MRISLPEIEDSLWLPRSIRDAMTGYLQVAIALGNPYEVVAPTLAELIRSRRDFRVVDLASGGGGPWPALVERLRLELGAYTTVTLTDLHPNLASSDLLGRLPGASYRHDSVSALAVPIDLDGVRTMFTALHHFDAAEVTTLMRSAQDARVPFLAAEATHRSLRGLLTTAFVPLLVLLLMPRVRPRRLLPLLLTYVFPILPILIWWDGLASTLKSYRAEELATLAAAIAVPGYAWHVEERAVRGAPIPVTVLMGRPVSA